MMPLKINKTISSQRAGLKSMYLFRKYFNSIVLFCVWLVSVLLTWRIVENPYWDLADLLYCSERLSLGQVIYLDFQQCYPPLMFWVFGLAMRLMPDSYAAMSAISACAALLFLIGNYKICRLLYSRSDALKIAVCVYLAVFTASSIMGPNFIAYGFVYIPITLFQWFVWFALKFVKDKPPHVWDCLAGGVLAGLCLLSKHERIGGVLGVSVFLVLVFLFYKRNKPYFGRMLIMFACMLAIAAGGYGFVIIRAGWFYVYASMTGLVQAFALQNIPVLTDVLAQALLIALHVGFVFAILCAVSIGRQGGDGPKIALASIKFMLGMLALIVFCLALEISRVVSVARQIDLGNAQYLTRTMLAIAFGSKNGEGLFQGVVNYFGNICFINILPLFSVIILLLVALAVRLLRRDGKARWNPSAKWLATAMLLCAVFCLQARFLARRSEVGALILAFPIFFLYAERMPFMVMRVKPKLSLWRAFKRYYLSGFMLVLILTSLVVYAYEFRDVLVNPIEIQSRKGKIRVPDLPMNRAFAELVSFVRGNDLARCKIVVVPTCGIQYWLGGLPPPFAWTALLQPEIYRSPWRDNLKENLDRNDCVFIELCRQEVSAQGVIISTDNWSWIDGPMYRVVRWKNSFPSIWSHIQSNTRPVAAFGPTNAPYFRVYYGANICLAGKHTDI